MMCHRNDHLEHITSHSHQLGALALFSWFSKTDIQQKRKNELDKCCFVAVVVVVDFVVVVVV